MSIHIQFRPQKCRKPVKIQKILYKSVITKNMLYLKIKNRFLIDWVCSGQFATFGNNNACLLPVIHAVYYAYSIFYQLKLKITGKSLIIRYIEVHKYLKTCYPTYCRVAILLQPFPCLNFNSFLSIHAHKVYMYRNHCYNTYPPSCDWYTLINLP